MFYKRLLATLAALIIVLGVPVPAMASTLLYAGSDVTADGGTIFGRVEDTSPDSAKLFNVYPAGAHPKGEEYAGCYGFTWIYSHDSYGYTGFSDDNSQGICPDCGSAHPHTPHQAGGTNEKGLSVTATGILHQNDEIRNIDPYVKAGIDEAEITTILLGEAATAKDAMLLLTTIYNSYGARRGVSVLVADPMEAWYIENLSGTQFAAVRLNPALLMLSADVSAIGRIDLDDTENIVTSHALIETAVEAGTFVGSQKDNVIDFAASYEGSGSYSIGSRMAAGLNYIGAFNTFSVYNDGQGIPRTAYALSNLDSRGSIVPLYTHISKARKLSVQDFVGFYRTSPIGKTMNAETHLFQIAEGDKSALGTVEWVALGNGRYSVFVPCYPMLTREAHPAYRAGHAEAAIATDEPSGRLSFDSEDQKRVVFPKGWSDSMYWCFEALSHLATEDDTAEAAIVDELKRLQEEVYEEWADLQEEVENTGDNALSTATVGSITIAERVYQGVLGFLRAHLDAELLS